MCFLLFKTPMAFPHLFLPHIDFLLTFSDNAAVILKLTAVLSSVITSPPSSVSYSFSPFEELKNLFQMLYGITAWILSN